MVLFLLGNGFDLHHFLPTTYPAFLRTVSFLIEKADTGQSITNVADVFGDKTLQAQDFNIKKCIEIYRENYTASLGEEADKLIELARDNFWFNYLKELQMIPNNWVDFEAEISRVIHTLTRNYGNIVQTRDLDKKSEPQLVLRTYNEGDKYTLRHLKTLFPLTSERSDGVGIFFISNKFISANPAGSENLVVDWGSVSEHLFSSLRDLTKMLSIYLRLFVEAPLTKLSEKGLVNKDMLLEMPQRAENADSGPRWQILPQTAIVVTLNYTRTCEMLYPNMTFSHFPNHFHGCLHDEVDECPIVLGINADQADELGSVDTTFLRFKKYYQRIYFETGLPIYRLCQEDNSKPVPLYVIGHSLDVTDKEIITALFNFASSITVFYHEPKKKGEYLHKITAIFGKAGLEELYTRKNLRFVEQSKLNDEEYVKNETVLWNELQ